MIYRAGRHMGFIYEKSIVHLPPSFKIPIRVSLFSCATSTPLTLRIRQPRQTPFSWACILGVTRVTFHEETRGSAKLQATPQGFSACGKKIICELHDRNLGKA